MHDLNVFLKSHFLGATAGDYLAFLGIVLGTFLFKRFISRLFARAGSGLAVQFSEGKFGPVFRSLIRKPLEWLLAVILWFYAFSFIEGPLEKIVLVHWKKKQEVEIFTVDELIHVLAAFFAIIFFLLLLSRLTDFFFRVKASKARTNAQKSSAQLMPLLKDVLKIILWTFGLFWILGAIFMVNIPALITGLGIGGVALALAAKETIENLLASFTILADKPFSLDDTVKLGALQGKVERIGFRSTKVRGADGSLLIVPNKKLIDETLENLSERDKRKVRLVIPIPNKRLPADLNALLSAIKTKIECLSQVLGGATVTIDSFALDHVQILAVYHLQESLNDEQIQMVIHDVNLKVYELLDVDFSQTP